MSQDQEPTNWSFYGRTHELAALGRIFSARRFFFLRLTGRRRIGKTTLVIEALRRSGRDRVAYVHVPDADPAGVVLGAREHLRLSGVEEVCFSDLFGLAATLGDLIRAGWIVVLDEYQAFARQSLYAFNSALQHQVDALRTPGAAPGEGGLVLLGSLQTEMEALLAGRRAPLFGRCTAVMHLEHLAPSEVVGILARHGRLDGPRLLFFWTLLQGIPKYWRDAYEVGALGTERHAALARLFFSGTAPLAADGAGWLLEELRGRYDPLLRYLARHPGALRADIAAHIAAHAGHTDPQVGAWLAALEERFRLVERVDPALTARKGRRGRYRITDNFLVAWLGALSGPVAFLGLRDAPGLIAEADRRLASLEGPALERLAAAFYEERSRRGVGDFSLTAPVGGWWDRRGAEVDLVAQDASSRRLRLGSCKRNPEKLIADLPSFDGHVARLLGAHRELAGWAVEKVAIAPALDPAQREAIARAGYIPQDLAELGAGLGG